MFAYVVRRILATIPVMAVVALFVFSLLYVAPGDPAAVIAGDQATPDDVERIRQSLGLDRPYLVRFGAWLWDISHGHLGTSIFTNLPVSTMIAQRIEPTLSLMVVTLVLAVSVAVPMGVLAAWKQGTWIDRAVMAFAVLGFSVPVFVVAYLLAYVFALELDWLPVQGYTPFSEGFGPWIENLVLPSIALGSVYIALIARITRATMLEVLQQDYIRTARAKGAGQRSILFLHALKNAAVSIVTVVGIGVALLIGGAVVTESVFAIPGLGRLTVDAILRRDYPVIQGVILLFSFVYVLVNLGVDLLYTVFDPNGSRIISKEAGGRYPHHRGIFYGHNRVKVPGQEKTLDIWSGADAHQAHVKFIREFAGPVLGGHVVTVDWVDREGKPFATETRTIRVFRSPKDQSLIQFDTTIATDGGPVALEASNNHHGGVQFRAAQEVAENEKATRFLRPGKWAAMPTDTALDVEQHKDFMDLPWNAIQYKLGDRAYTVAYLCNPENPRKAEMSERAYGRFGEYSTWNLTKDNPLTLTYRFWVSATHDVTQKDVDVKARDFASPPKTAVR